MTLVRRCLPDIVKEKRCRQQVEFVGLLRKLSKCVVLQDGKAKKRLDRDERSDRLR